MYMWRAVDSEGEVLEILVQPNRDKGAAMRLLGKAARIAILSADHAPTAIIGCPDINAACGRLERSWGKYL